MWSSEDESSDGSPSDNQPNDLYNYKSSDNPNDKKLNNENCENVSDHSLGKISSDVNSNSLNWDEDEESNEGQSSISSDNESVYGTSDFSDEGPSDQEDSLFYYEFGECNLNDSDVELMKAIKSKCLASVLKSIEEGADVNHKYSHGPPLFYAIRRNSDTIVSALLEAGANPNLLHNYKSPLLLAVSKLKCETIKPLLEAGADVNFHYPWGQKNKSILHNALIGHNTATIKLLLDHGADVHAKDNQGESVLCYASSHRSPTRYPAFDDRECVDVLKLLIERGAQILKDGPNGEDQSFKVILSRGTLNCLKLFLANGTKLENYRYRPVLHLMYRNPQKETIEFVLKTNIFDIEMKSDAGRTVLQQAVKDYINPDRLDLWLRYGANPNSFNVSGRTALHIALRSCRSKNVKYLLESGARLSIEILRQAGSLRSFYHKDICIKLFVAHLALIEGQDLDFDSDASELIDLYNSQLLYKTCKEEVRLLKQTTIYGQFTYYDILFSENVYQITGIELVRTSFKDCTLLSSKFPTYGKRIYRRFSRLQEKLGAFKGLSRLLVEFDQDVFRHIYHNILQNLRRVDLENLSRV
ncbi:hypothetical protein QAD02_019511 [Eretmocerus hayati]|uniref:Uncharacterized protein n=1 Tax=Eretmocerus hayati TaxID=131215 RepID=A0ACC2PMA6_9HYME|nr:hypothetical protein QAD02_019511 [Eretmocerus hayati]